MERSDQKLQTLIEWLVSTIGRLGYPGIATLMFLESSFFPFPSEVVMPPAGYLAAQGRMNLWVAIAMGTLGSLLGALFNYWVAVRFGRPFLERYGKYLFISEETLKKAEQFFLNHGHISTFIGRLLPGIRQYISLPAGLARMKVPTFCVFTALGAGIWSAILAWVGYWVGYNQELVAQYLHSITVTIIAACAIIIALYLHHLRKKKDHAK